MAVFYPNGHKIELALASASTFMHGLQTYLTQLFSLLRKVSLETVVKAGRSHFKVKLSNGLRDFMPLPLHLCIDFKIASHSCFPK